MDIARNSAPISFAVPGAERKRTRLNAPATATPAPRLPFASMMTSCTTAGKIASVTAKLCVVRERYMETSAVPTPSSSDTAVQMRNETSVNSLPKIELSTEGILL